MLDRLLDFHMWTADFAEDRLKWKRKDPLHVLILRVYLLKEPMEIPVLLNNGSIHGFLSEWSGAARNDAGGGRCGF